MSADLPFDPGLPVEIGRIDKELGKLWESSDDTKTRASLINLVVYSEDEKSIGSDNSVLAAVASRHACRAILILGRPQSQTASAKAWINAHCHLIGKGTRQICSEQITFLLEGDSASALPNIVFSHLDSDLPLCLWWRGDFPEPLDEKLWAWVDRLIYDSADWRHPAHQIAMIRHISLRAKHTTVLCDLNWTRLRPWRFATASLFDHSAAFPHLARVESVKIHCAPGARISAMLMLAWLANRLEWTAAPDGKSFQRAGGVVSFSIDEVPGANISQLNILSSDGKFELSLDGECGFFESSMEAPGLPATRQILPAPCGKIEDTLLAELSRAGRHPLYTDCLEFILPLLPR